MAAAGRGRRRAGRAVAEAARRPARGRSARAASRAVRHLATCSTATRCTGRSWSAAGRRGRTVTGRRELWRRLNARIAGARTPRPAVETACARLRAEPGLAELPERLSLFGLTRLPAGQLRVLRALAEHRDVHLFLLHPSPALWERIAARAPRVTRRADDATARLAAQPPARVLGAGLARAAARDRARGGVARAPGRAPRPARCSPALQAAVREDRPLEPGETDAQHPGPRLPRPRAPGRGRARRDPAPAGGRPDARAARRGRDVPGHRGFRAADPGARSGRGRAPTTRTTSCPRRIGRPTCASGSPTARCARPTRCSASSPGCWSSPGQRLTASQVLDLTDREPVRRRFRLDDDDVARLEDWVADSGIRWGLDAEHRAPFKLAELARGHVAVRAGPAAASA